ncbi:MAG: hypothetical protein ACI4SJ_04715 [Candidatus Avispirillum sp.]
MSEPEKCRRCLHAFGCREKKEDCGRYRDRDNMGRTERVIVYSYYVAKSARLRAMKNKS